MNQDQYTVGKLFELTGCIAQDVLLKYVDGKLTKAEVRKVEMHIVDCPLCDAALEGVQAAGTHTFAAMTARVDERVQSHLDAQSQEEDNVIEFRPTIHPPVAQPQTKRFLSYFSIAASIVLIAVLSFIFLNGGNAGSIADHYLQQHSISDARTVRGDAPAAPVSPEAAKLSEAQAAYDAKNYTTAASLFEAIGTPEATFQAGNCYYLNGQYDIALQRFQTVTSTKSVWKGYAEMNLAMTYLKLDRVGDAKAALEKIVAQPKHDFYKQADKALQEVNDL